MGYCGLNTDRSRAVSNTENPQTEKSHSNQSLKNQNKNKILNVIIRIILSAKNIYFNFVSSHLIAGKGFHRFSYASILPNCSS